MTNIGDCEVVNAIFSVMIRNCTRLIIFLKFFQPAFFLGEQGWHCTDDVARDVSNSDGVGDSLRDADGDPLGELLRDLPRFEDAFSILGIGMPLSMQFGHRMYSVV